jgi:hypothetical protein
LIRSLAATLAEKSQTITLKRLQEYALSAAQCEQIALEMIEGERYFADEDESSRRLIGLLGLQQEAVTRDSQPTTGKAPQRVGERKPQRDKIG